MPVYFAKDKKRWRWEFDRIVSGRRHRLTKLLPAGWSRTQAEAFDRSESSRLHAIATGIEQPTLTLAHAVKLYLDHRIPHLKDGKGIAGKLAAIYDEIERTPLQEVGDMTRRYAAENAGKSAPGTIHNRISYLRAAVRYAYRVHGYGDRNWADRITLPPLSNARQVYLRHPEVKRLLAAIDDKDARAVFTLAYYTGFRWKKELLPRTSADVRMMDGEPWLLAGTTKNGTPRMKVVHPDARWALKHLPFTSPWWVYWIPFKRARKALGLEHVRAHDLRHSLASDIISRGGTLSDVQGALHHDSVASSKRYAHLYPERLRDVLLGVGRNKSPHRVPRATKKKYR